MKKFFPIFVILGSFVGFLAIQAGFELIHLNASTPTKVDGLNQQYKMSLKSLEIETTEKTKIVGSKISTPVIILNFWASWCIPCIHEFPSLNKLRAAFTKEQVLIIGINADEENQMEMIKKSKSKFNLNFDIVADKNSKLTDKFSVSAVPVSIIFIGGEVYHVSNGAYDFYNDELVNKIKAVLKK